MKTKLITIPLALTLILQSHFSFAITLKVKEMYDNCKTAISIADETKKHERVDLLNAGDCVGYFTGVINTHNTLAVLFASPPVTDEKIINNSVFCMGSKVTIEQVARMFVSYIDENRDLMDKDATVQVLKMLMIKFPCEYKGKEEKDFKGALKR